MPFCKIQLIAGILLGAMICFLPLSLPAAPEDADSQEVLSQPIQKAEAKTLKDISRRLEKIQTTLPDLLNQVEEEIQRLTPRLNQLLRLKAFVGNDFRKIGLIRQALQNLKRQFQGSIEPLKSLEQELEELRSTLESSKESLIEQLKFPVAWNVEKTKQLYTYEDLRQELRNLEERLDRVKEMRDSFTRHIVSLQEQTKREMSTAWVDYFLKPDPSILKSDLRQWIKEYKAWQQGLPVYLNFFLLGETAWIPFLSYLLLLTIAIFFLLFGSLRFLNKKISGIPASLCLPSLIMISTALGIWFTSIIHQSTYQSLFFSTLAQLLAMRGLVQLCQRVSTEARPEEVSRSNFLVVLWYAFAGALVLRTLDFPALPMQGLWTVLLVIVSVWIGKQQTPIGLNLEKAIHKLSLLILPGLAILSLLGWINLSLLMTAFWFVLALSLQYGSLGGHLLKRRIASMPETKLGYLRRGITQGTGIPIIWIGSILLATLWLEVNLGDFQLLQQLSELKIGWGKLSINFFRLLLVMVSFYVVRSGLIILRTLIDSIAEVNAQLDPGTTATLKTLLTYLVWGIFLMISLAFIGVNLTSLTVVAGGLSVGIGFGMQSIVNNFISGLILLFGRSIKPGDIIQLGDLWATVKEVNIRTTEVITFDQSNVFVPNSQLIGDQITNWTHQNKTIRRKIIVGVAYGSDIDLVKRLLLYLAETNPNVYKIPAPFCRFIDFGSSSLDFCLYVYVSIDNAWETESELRFDIDKIFREYKVEIAFPQQDVHLKWGDGLEKLLERYTTNKAGEERG
ncbi:MAG: mechanosensitive ion channel [Desulfohalobiaceae bacterium]|nr:mechanosensitive ion channel [Desulfohalobiaceae bacterium]